jgi:hypothetical protein
MVLLYELWIRLLSGNLEEKRYFEKERFGWEGNIKVHITEISSENS